MKPNTMARRVIEGWSAAQTTKCPGWTVPRVIGPGDVVEVEASVALALLLGGRDAPRLVEDAFTAAWEVGEYTFAADFALDWQRDHFGGLVTAGADQARELCRDLAVRRQQMDADDWLDLRAASEFTEISPQALSRLVRDHSFGFEHEHVS